MFPALLLILFVLKQIADLGQQLHSLRVARILVGPSSVSCRARTHEYWSRTTTPLNGRTQQAIARAYTTQTEDAYERTEKSRTW